MELSIIIPCYNEGGNLEALIHKLKELSKTGISLEIILVDNGSTDSTPHFLKTKEPELATHAIKTLRIDKNLGYGFGILQGLEAAQGVVLAWTHADLQTNPMDVLKAYEVFKKTPHSNFLVKGKRVNRPFMAALFSKGMEWVVWWALKVNLHEINAQPKLFSKAFYLAHIQNKAPFDFSLDLFLLVQAKRYGEIKEIEVRFDKRLSGEAKGGGGSLKNRWKLIKRTWAYIFELRNKELKRSASKGK